MLLVPGTFGCKDIGLAKSDELVAEKLELYLQWAESDTRIAGFNPWQCVASLVLCSFAVRLSRLMGGWAQPDGLEPGEAPWYEI